VTPVTADSRVRELADDLIAFLETGEPPEGLFAPRVFFDVTVPHWRLQAEGWDEAVALRREQHPAHGRVVRSRLDETKSGFVLEFEERWHERGRDWYAAREEEHRQAVRLLRP
jgi:hypothetical protein